MLAPIFVLVGCGAAPDYYLLPAQSPTAMRSLAPSQSVVVTDFNLPSYAQAVEIPSLQHNGVLALDRDANWADEPRRAVTRHFSEALALRLGSLVATDPWPAYSQEPVYRVEVAVDQFIGTLGGTVSLRGQYFILRAREGTISASDRFQIDVPTSDVSYVAFVAAHSRALEILADRIASRISGRALPTS
ncbi:MAG: PqiC family protein [Pseudomonadota bacterium]